MPEPTPASQAFPITVVMATLGGETLKGTIEQLNRGSVVPAEILICIPEKEAPRTADLCFPNVRVIVTACRGQVAQRAVGFQAASHEVVMQLDDDIFVDEEAVACMLQTLTESGQGVAVASSLIGHSACGVPNLSDGMLKLFYFLVNGRDGYRTGTVSKAGTEIGFKKQGADQKVIDVEWMPGGCVIHWRANLVKENFFPFKGKAYCEDLMHSHLLAEKGVRLKMDLRAHCYFTSISSATLGVKEFIDNLRGDYRARKYFVSLSSRSLVRMHLYYACVVSNFMLKKVIVNCND